VDPTLYYAPNSTATITRVVLEELGVPYDKVKLDLRAGDAKKADFVRLNPNAKVPLLVHDGEPIFESVAITIHLGETYGVDKGLFPPPGVKRAAALKWLVWTHVTLGDGVSRYAHAASSWVPEEQHNAKAAEAAKADVERCLAILDEALAPTGHLVGSAFTIVDAHVASFVGYVGILGFDLKKHPALAAWLAACEGRPAAQRVEADGG
jgi:glutathione S-transferase